MYGTLSIMVRTLCTKTVGHYSMYELTLADSVFLDTGDKQGSAHATMPADGCAAQFLQHCLSQQARWYSRVSQSDVAVKSMIFLLHALHLSLPLRRNCSSRFFSLSLAAWRAALRAASSSLRSFSSESCCRASSMCLPEKTIGNYDVRS